MSENGQLPQANHKVLTGAHHSLAAPWCHHATSCCMAVSSMNMFLNRTVTTFQIIFLLYKIVLHIIGSLALMAAINTYNHFDNQFPNQARFKYPLKSGATTY